MYDALDVLSLTASSEMPRLATIAVTSVTCASSKAMTHAASNGPVWRLEATPTRWPAGYGFPGARQLDLSFNGTKYALAAREMTEHSPIRRHGVWHQTPTCNRSPDSSGPVSER